MKPPRPRAIQSSVLGVSLTLLAALLLLIMGSVQAQASLPVGSPPGSPETPWDYPVCFTGQDHVDLKWDSDPWYDTYIVMRNGDELKRFGSSVTFYRDRSAVKGETYTYQICAQHLADPPSCGLSSTTTVGQIHGLLYEYLSWSADDYQLSGDVIVRPGATLHIGGGATVTGDTDSPIYDHWPGTCDLGAVQVDGATIQAVLNLCNGGSWVEGSTIGGAAYGGVTLSQWNGEALAGNTFTSTSVLYIIGSSGQKLQVHDNTFYAAQIWATGTGEVRIHGNRFEKGSSVLVENAVSGGISGNTFYDSEIGVTSTGYFDINNNRMRLLDPNTAGSTGLIVVSSLSPNVGIYGNLLDGYMSGFYGTGGGISAGAWQGGSGIINIHDNIVTELDKGIGLQGPLRAFVFNNTITHNQTGIYVKGNPGIEDPDVAAFDNCISGNAPYAGNIEWGGLTTFRVTQTVLATGNYWGHPSGPTHLLNPGGQGDRVQELDASQHVITGVVDYAGWLPSHHCNEADLGVAGLEAVQSIQDLNNSVPLVTGKPTVVRIYADSGMAPEVTGVPVELKVSRNGSLLGSKQGALTARPVTKWDWVRAATDEGLAIRLDGDWLSGTLNLTVTLNAQHTISESTFSNNEVTYTLRFTERKPLLIGLAPIEYRPLQSMEPRMPLTEELPSLVQFLHKAYPVSDVRVTLLPPVWWPFMMKGSDSEVPRGRQLLRELTYVWSIYHRTGAEPGQSLDQIVGVFPADCEVGGDITMSESDPRWLGGKGLASYMCSGDGGILAHELAHNLGLYHPCSQAQAANCCQAWHPGPPSTPPPDWPYGNASIQEYGFDTVESAIVLRATPDLMTWCEPKWLSPFHYKKLFQANGAPQPPVVAPPGGSLHQTGAGTYLLVGGLVDITGTVAFDPFWQLTAAQPALDPLEGSDYCLELWDAQTVLQSRCFDLSFYDYESGEEIAADGFVTAMPLDPAASRVVLRQGNTELDEVVASAYTPTVTLLAPNTTVLQSGHITVTWTAADADPGDELAFVLSYSNDDGVTWLPFALNLTGTTSYELDLSNLPGGTACRVKVDASDGWHNASDESDSSFQVGDKVPLAGITEPVDGAVVATPLTLQGYGYDLEDGQLQGAALQWSSDIDGPLGSGDTLWDVDLSLGQHTLTLQVTDSQGHTAVAEVTITVMEGPGLEHIYLPLVLRGY